MILKLKKDVINNPELLPGTSGIFKFHSGNEILYLAKTTDIRRSVSSLLTSQPEDEQVLKMISLTKEISWEVENNILSALLKEKIELSRNVPHFNILIDPLSDYVYLSINFQKVPYFSLSENTLQEDYYLGPFFNRFFLLDFIAVIGELMQYPACENGNYPCLRYQEGTCSGWCLKDSSETAEMIVNNYLVINEDLVKKLKNQQQTYFKNLEFEKESALKDQLEIILKYYDLLKFFHTVKQIDLNFSYNNHEIKLQKGQIEELIFEGKTFNFPISKPQYRSNEYLAIEKIQLSESRILYNYLKKKYSQKIDQIYFESEKNIYKVMDLNGE
jgi:excinuclease UvrABC nuclease subunit